MSEYVANRIFICIDEYSTPQMSGRLYHTKLPDESLFTDSHQLMLTIESLLNAVNYPEASMEPRIFRAAGMAGAAQKKPPFPDEDAATVPLDVRGKLATFIVHAQYRQNTSWQGTLLWLEKKQTQFFRSELELLRLVDSALAS